MFLSCSPVKLTPEHMEINRKSLWRKLACTELRRLIEAFFRMCRLHCFSTRFTEAIMQIG